MQTLEYRYIDKSTWGEGPWQSEPDKIQWQDEATGLPCLIVRTREIGSLCGYVGVPRSHPFHFLNYSDERLDDVHVHGGLTFSGMCQSDEHGICHVVEEGEDDKVWWFGFDCAHSGDLMPGTEALLAEHLRDRPIPDDTYKTLEYVKAKVKKLAQQLFRAEFFRFQ